MRLPFAPRERAGLIACTLLVALAVAVRLIYGPNIRDDAYITLRYAANLASGYGFVYNPGEAVLGTSTPLYTLFLAGLKAAGLDPIGAAVALGVMSDAAAIVVIGELEVDGRTRRVSLGGEELTLTPKEFDLLAFLSSDPGAVFTRQDILESVWDAHWYGPTKTLDVHVAALRKKLGDACWIETVRGVGFRLVAPR